MIKYCIDMIRMVAIALVVLAATASSSPSYAQCGTATIVPPETTPPEIVTNVVADACGVCGCTLSLANATINLVIAQHDITRNFISNMFSFHESWFFNSGQFYGCTRDGFFELHILPAMMMMTEQLVSTAMEQMLILGTFFDAQLQLETQRLFQKKAAEAHKDYHPSFDMCVIGTTARSLAAADRNGEFTSYVMSQRSQDRQIGIYSANAGRDDSIDRKGRIEQVKNRYCDTRDNDNKLVLLCPTKANPETVNKDIDYHRTVDSVRTLNIDWTDGTASNDEQDILALASNLFSHETLTKPGRTALNTEDAHSDFMEMRSILAKRNVAEDSFNTIVGLKSAGTTISQTTMGFTEKVLEQFGVTSQNERRILLGGTLDDGVTGAERISYYAQLETLAQKIYQDPEFFSNLYDKPSNVLRKDVAMQAINLMLERDMHKSELRSEMVLSVFLELELMKYQDDVQRRLDAMTEKYEEN